MFGNSKEYQDIKKLYEEKVSKTEDIKEFKSKFSKPQQPVKSPMEAGMGPGAAKARAMAKARIAAKKAASQPKSTPSVDSFKQGMKTPLNVSDTSKPTETKPTETKPTETKTTPTYQDNRNRQNRLRQQQNKGRAERQFGFLKPKPIEKKEGQTSVRSRGGGVKTKPESSDVLKAKPIEKKEGQTSVRSRGGGAQTKPNTETGTKTGTETNTQIKKFPGSGKEINPKAKVTQTTSTNDKGQKVTTTTAKTSLQGSEATDAIKKAKERRAQLRANSMKEAYASIYNQPTESENIDETIIRKDGSMTHGAPKDRGPKGGKKPSAETPKGEPRKNTGHPVKIIDGKPVKMAAPGMREDYTPYDIVLEYLLSTEQAATIEEANYIMTEMDAETIQGIVSEGLGSAIKKVVKKGMKKLKGGEMKGDFPDKGDGSYTA